MSRYNRCKECYNMKCVFVTGEREDIDTSECADFRPMTNADRLRSMSDEELATFFGTLPCCPPGNADELCFPDNTCGADTKMMVKCWGTWLKSPGKVDNG